MTGWRSGGVPDVTTLKDLSNDSPQYFDGFTLFRVALVAEDEEGTQ